ncbi:hypothetical protein SH611_02910 [Geminicoccaceae bacterium 1502E]|nr:hypothetical protein [Geminicoccaceae bacterium 1502E]
MGSGVGWMLLGILLGGAGAFLYLARKSDERVAQAQEGVARQISQAQEDALQADMAHAETKERLIELQMRHRDLEKRLRKHEEQQASAARLAAAASGETVDGAENGRAGRANSARLKAIEAKLAQLPAGSSARARLERQRGRLLRHS